MSQSYAYELKNATVLNHVDGIAYIDNPKIKDVRDLDFEKLTPIMDARKWTRKSNGQGVGSKAASIIQDPLSLTEVFFNNGTEATNFGDIANSWLSEIQAVRKSRDVSRAAAIITSKDYSLLQDTVVLAESQETIRVGPTAGMFEETSLSGFSGKFRDFEHDLKWHRNLPESKSPEPSLGKVSEFEVSIQKHGGAVAITERAKDVINGGNIFGRLVSQLQQVGDKDENKMVVEEIESNTGNSETGVDFGATSGTPPLNTQNPSALIGELIKDFVAETSPEGSWNLFFSKEFVFNEYATNSNVRGSNGGLPILNQEQQVEGVRTNIPGFPAGVRWVTDDAFSDGTKGWAADRKAIRKFRRPTRAYTIQDPEKEFEKYTTKRHFSVETLYPGLIWLVTGISA